MIGEKIKFSYEKNEGGIIKTKVLKGLIVERWIENETMYYLVQLEERIEGKLVLIIDIYDIIEIYD